MTQDASLSCRRCSRPVGVSARDYDTFEQMHYVCFHYEFEHDPSDVDAVCGAGGCPSEVTAGRASLLSTLDELLAQWQDTDAPSTWDNKRLPDYLEALRAWLADSDGYYLNRKQAPPWSAAVLLSDGLRAARVYE